MNIPKNILMKMAIIGGTLASTGIAISQESPPDAPSRPVEVTTPANNENDPQAEETLTPSETKTPKETPLSHRNWNEDDPCYACGMG